MGISFRILWLSASLAMLLFPFVHHRAGTSPGSIIVDVLIAFALAMGFCAPLFLFYAEIRRKSLSRNAQSSASSSEVALRQETEIEMKGYYWAAAVGIFIGIVAGWVRYF